MLVIRKGVIVAPAVIGVKEGMIDEINPKQLPGGMYKLHVTVFMIGLRSFIIATITNQSAVF
jgi:hypothetical protein